MAKELWDIAVRAGLVTTAFLLNMVVLEIRRGNDKDQATADHGYNGVQAPSCILPSATS